MGGICSLCLKNNIDTEDEEIDLTEFNDGDKDDENHATAAVSEGRASETIYVLDPQTFEFLDALHLPKDAKNATRNPSRGFLEVPLLRRVSKRNSLTSWLAGGLFSPKGSKNESFGVSTSPPSYASSSSSRDKTSLRPIKMLMSGAGESGKSTVVKQMKIIHQGGFSTEELNDFRMHIYRNIQESMLQILEVMDSNELCRDERTLVYTCFLPCTRLALMTFLSF